MQSVVATFITPAHIAVIKSWGHPSETHYIPMNDSISVTLDTQHFYAKTTVMASPDFTEDKMWLNGREESMDNPKLKNCIRMLRKAARQAREIKQWKIHICSVNNFATDVGFTPSFDIECVGIVKALASLYNYEADISGLVRASYGSACRSTCGGFVYWTKGPMKGFEGIASTINPSCHWPHMRILILVVNDLNKKKFSSRTDSTQSSEFFKYRAEKIPYKIISMTESIVSKNFYNFATLTMKESNQIHAACMDSFPPSIYLNDTSHLIIDLVHEYNDVDKEIKVAYTFDTSSNATLFLLKENVPEFIGVLEHYFPPSATEICKGFRKGIDVQSVTNKELLRKLKFTQQSPGKLKYIIHTKVGDGPYKSYDHLLDTEGLPETATTSSNTS